MTATQPPSALRGARHARGWSLTETAQRLVALGAARGATVASARSLRSQLSRWENGHAVPEPTYRALLAELLAQPPGALGIAPPVVEPAEAAADRLRAALAAATTVARSGVDAWRAQLAALRRLDDELGTEAAADLTGALVERLDRLLRHTVERRTRGALAEVLSAATALAGAHALDRGAPDEAWRRYDRARATAIVAENPRALAAATSGLVEVLIEIGEPEAALTLLDETELDVPDTDPAAVRLAAATATAAAAAGHPSVALAALARVAAGRPAPAPDAPPVDRVHPIDPPIELADLHRWRAGTLALLGGAATDDLRQALAAPPRAVRHRAEVLADLATALVDVAPEEAGVCAREARGLALRIGAPRITARLEAGRSPP